jgi:membrane protein implicated in regulation of membrane protease activity
MALAAAILLAVFVLPGGWGLAAVVLGAAVEVGEALFWVRWSQRRKAQVGVEALVGVEAEVREGGYVFVQGELWRARGAEGLERGSRVRVRAVDGLTLVVEPL